MSSLLSDFVENVSHAGIRQISTEDVEGESSHENRLEAHSDLCYRRDLLARKQHTLFLCEIQIQTSHAKSSSGNNWPSPAVPITASSGSTTRFSDTEERRSTRASTPLREFRDGSWPSCAVPGPLSADVSAVSEGVRGGVVVIVMALV